MDLKESKYMNHELTRTLKVLNLWLSNSKYLTGPEISIADLAAINELKTIEILGLNYQAYPHIVRWAALMFEIP